MSDNFMMKILACKPGTFNKVVFTTSPKMKAKYKNDNLEVLKTTRLVARTGINYYNLKSVKDSGAVPDKTRKSSFESVVKNKIVHNKNTNGYYLNLFPNWKQCKSSFYLRNKEDGTVIPITDKEAKEFVLASVFNVKHSSPMIRVNLNHIEYFN